MEKSTLAKLRKKQIEQLFDSTEFYSGLKETANEIAAEVKSQAKNEATVSSIFEIELYVFIKDLFGLKFHPIKEEYVDTVRHIASGKKDATGRIDSRIGALIIEYKYCEKLKTDLQKASAIDQLVNYLKGLYKQSPHEYAGFVTDGIQASLLSIDQNGEIKGNSAFENLSAKHLEKILKTIFLLEKSAFTPENLVKDFCTPEGKSISNRLIVSLFEALETNITSRSQMLLNEWKELFKLAHDDQSKQKPILERRESLTKVVGRTIKNNDEEYLALYALQTSYAIIIKIIAYKFIGRIRYNKSFISFSDLATATSDQLRSQLQLLEEGAIFRSIGIGNLLEGDFFAWYCTESQWSQPIATSIKEIFSVLREYEDAKLFTEYREIQDLFKDLFTHIMPDKVRHSLGEYYTPEWLADNLINSALSKISNKRWLGLDPCSGSGTFVIAMIKHVLQQTQELSKKEQLNAVLSRVKALDLNPLAVLTTRINYFINIASLIGDEDDFEIPVYLGDSSYVPKPAEVDGVSCLSYQIKTLKGYLDIILPKSTVSNPTTFSKTMTSIEVDISNHDKQAIVDSIVALTSKKDRKPLVLKHITSLAEQFIELEKNDWNGIWARIVTNFLTTANIGKFDIIVGNPPWIDWKNLPAGYRERIKGLCIDRKLFSGDSMTGGINLNICALIANVAAENWLSELGVLAFLMPENLAFQQSYKGFREFHVGFDSSKRLYFQEFFVWKDSGHPFYPVQHPFMSYFISKEKKEYGKGIPVKEFIKKKQKGVKLKNLFNYRNKTKFSDVENLFEIKDSIAGAITPDQNLFTFADNASQLKVFGKIAGESNYTGRDGLDFYPNELFMFSYAGPAPKGCVLVTNHQNSKTHHKLAKQTIPIEKELLFPLIRSPEISKYHVSPSEYLVPFPYLDKSRSPIPRDKLAKQAPKLMKYFNENRNLFKAKTSYNAKIIGKKHNSEYYAIARVGSYTFAKNFVVFRKDTKWVAAVISEVETPWGEKKSPRFLSHAVSISERSDGKQISVDEAHFICAVLNSPTVVKYILKSSDKRSFKVRPQIRIPYFDKSNPVHTRLSNLSKEAHRKFNDKREISRIDKEVDMLAVQL